MTTRPSDPDGWYAPDKPAPVPEGMETTDEIRGAIKISAETFVDIFPNGALSKQLLALLRDFDHNRASIARLAATNADLRAVNLRHAEASARIAEIEAALDEIARQRTLAEDEAHWYSEREGEEWSPDVETGYDGLIDIARRVSRARPGGMNDRAWDLYHEDAERSDLVKAKARIAELETVVNDAEAQTQRYKVSNFAANKRIAELENQLEGAEQRGALILDVIAERDRLKAALTKIANSGAREFGVPADHVTWAIWQSRAALSGEGVTT